jgi:indole-3-glycerol phosphate synthase/phosphoribosylanthranilate isomerase
MALASIVADKRAAVAARMSARPLASFKSSLAPSQRSLARALSQPRTGFILECKRASPSQGLIREPFDPRAIAKSYAPFCDAISVLTDEPYFRGSFDHLRAVRETVDAPVLCKDFVVDPYQVYEARSHGADAILLMCSVLDDAGIAAGLSACRELAMDALVEVHDDDELDRAIMLGAPIVGVNNRNLKTLAIDITTTRRLAPRVPRDRLLVCESGIERHAEVRELSGSVDAFLVGTSLMREASLDDAVRRLIFGRVKICGLTQRDHAIAARAAGASFGGLVLWPGSPRAVDLAAATRVRAEVDLYWIGVFVDEEPTRVATAARELDLHAVQLHGYETREYVAELRKLLPGSCAIWKATRVGDPRDGAAIDVGADRLLLDAYREGQLGGTGTAFDWVTVQSHPSRRELILSGGIDPHNVAHADALDCWALDLSSGVESAPGEKDPDRIQSLFHALRGESRHLVGTSPEAQPRQ